MKLLHLVVLLLAGALLAAAVTYMYDDAGRLVLVDYGNGSTIAYTYDKAPAPKKSAKPKPMSIVHFLTGRSV